jgi:lipopolysaccharide/colanic/teichoic acid biosynthesis glycosyltransferase
LASRNTIIKLLIGDLFLILLSYAIVLFWKSSTLTSYLGNFRYNEAIGVFLIIALLTSAIFGKYSISGKNKISEIFGPIIKSNLMIMGLVSFLIYILQQYYFSRLLVFGTIYVLTLFEFAGGLLFYYAKKSKLSTVFDFEGIALNSLRQKNEKDEIAYDKHDIIEEDYSEEEIKDLERSLRFLNKYNKELIIEESGEKVYAYISRFIDINSPRSAILSTTTRFNIEKQPGSFLRAIVNLHRINDIRRINKFFESANRKLPKKGIFICCVETKNMRKKRIFRKFPPVISHIYYLIDFVYKRVWPKLPVLNRIYFFLNRGHNRVLSKQETMGRLYSCGFELLAEAVIDNLQYIVTEKVKKPVYDEQPSYGPVFSMRRIGKDGKVIHVFKFRTMYPYSEYLQKYIHDKHKLEPGGKFGRDIRVTTLGRIFRRFWLDEIPMLVNWFRGDLKLVGVRPLSEHYLSLYSDELRRYRLNFKPGLIPPYYADLPKEIDEIMASEMKYLQAYSRSPFFTDFKYFFKIWFNIIFRRARSK